MSEFDNCPKCKATLKNLISEYPTSSWTYECGTKLLKSDHTAGERIVQSPLCKSREDANRPEKETTLPKVVIIMEKGAIQSVLTDTAGAEVVIVDLDRGHEDREVAAANADILGMANENCYEEAYII